MTADIHHIRRPDLPWRQSTGAECGVPLAATAATADRDDVLAQVDAEGVQRTTAAGVCLPCITQTTRWPPYAADPVRALAREYAEPDPRFAAELRALGVMVAARREEFDTLLAETSEVTDLATRRRRRTA